jgi:hypothetical protein
MSFKEAIGDIGNAFDAAFAMATNTQPAAPKGRSRRTWEEGVVGKYGVRVNIANLESVRTDPWQKIIQKKTGEYSQSQLRTELTLTNGARVPVTYCKNTGVASVKGDKASRATLHSELAKQFGFRLPKKLKFSAGNIDGEFTDHSSEEESDDEEEAEKLPPKVTGDLHNAVFGSAEVALSDAGSEPLHPLARMSKLTAGFSEQNRRTIFGLGTPTDLNDLESDGEADCDEDERSLDSEFRRDHEDESDRESISGEDEKKNPENNTTILELFRHMVDAGAFVGSKTEVSKELVEAAVAAGMTTGQVEKYFPKNSCDNTGDATSDEQLALQLQKMEVGDAALKAAGEDSSQDSKAEGLSAKEYAVLKQIIDAHTNNNNDSSSTAAETSGSAEGNHQLENISVVHRKSEPIPKVPLPSETLRSLYIRPRAASSDLVPGSNTNKSEDQKKEVRFFRMDADESENGSTLEANDRSKGSDIASGGSIATGGSSNQESTQNGEMRGLLGIKSGPLARALAKTPGKSAFQSGAVEGGGRVSSAEARASGENLKQNETNLILSQILKMLEQNNEASSSGSRNKDSTETTKLKKEHPELFEFLDDKYEKGEEEGMKALFLRKYGAKFCTEAENAVLFNSIRDLVESEIGEKRTRPREAADKLRVFDLPQLKAANFTKTYNELLQCLSGKIAYSNLTVREIISSVWGELLRRAELKDPDSSYVLVAHIDAEYPTLPLLLRMERWEEESRSDGDEDEYQKAELAAAEHTSLFSHKLPQTVNLKLLESSVRRAVRRRMSVKQQSLRDKTPLGAAALESFVSRIPMLEQKFNKILGGLEDAVGAQVKKKGGLVIIRYSVLFAAFNVLRAGGRTTDIIVSSTAMNNSNKKTTPAPFHSGDPPLPVEHGTGTGTDSEIDSDLSGLDQNPNPNADGGTTGANHHTEDVQTTAAGLHTAVLQQILTQLNANSNSNNNPESAAAAEAVLQRHRAANPNQAARVFEGNQPPATRPTISAGDAEPYDFGKLTESEEDEALKQLVVTKKGRVYDWNLFKLPPLSAFTVSPSYDGYGWARRAVYRKVPYGLVFGPQTTVEKICLAKAYGYCFHRKCNFSHVPLPAAVLEKMREVLTVDPKALEATMQEKFDNLLDVDKPYAKRMLEVGFEGSCLEITNKVLLRPLNLKNFADTKFFAHGSGAVDGVTLGDLLEN